MLLLTGKGSEVLHRDRREQSNERAKDWSSVFPMMKQRSTLLYLPSSIAMMMMMKPLLPLAICSVSKGYILSTDGFHSLPLFLSLGKHFPCEIQKSNTLVIVLVVVNSCFFVFFISPNLFLLYVSLFHSSLAMFPLPLVVVVTCEDDINFQIIKQRYESDVVTKSLFKQQHRLDSSGLIIPFRLAFGVVPLLDV